MPLFDVANEIILENDRAKLRPLILDDHNNLAPIAFKNQDLLRLSPSEIHTTEKLQAYITAALKAKADGIRYPFIIIDKADQAYAGSTSFGNISNQNQRIEIGWTWIGKDFQGSGLNQACKALLLSYAFDTLEFERVELKTDTRNLQSRRAMEKIGAQMEGTLRSHTVMSDGYRRDTVYYSILRNEWPNIKSTIFSDYF